MAGEATLLGRQYVKEIDWNANMWERDVSNSVGRLRPANQNVTAVDTVEWRTLVLCDAFAGRLESAQKVCDAVRWRKGIDLLDYGLRTDDGWRCAPSRRGYSKQRIQGQVQQARLEEGKDGRKLNAERQRGENQKGARILNRTGSIVSILHREAQAPARTLGQTVHGV